MIYWTVFLNTEWKKQALLLVDSWRDLWCNLKSWLDKKFKTQNLYEYYRRWDVAADENFISFKLLLAY
jgi:hypothetical protein